MVYAELRRSIAMNKIIYQPVKERILTFNRDFIFKGQIKGYFLFEKGFIKYSCSGKKYNFFNSHEILRARFYFDLIEKYKYPADRISFDVEIGENIERLADIVVYDDTVKGIPFLAIECAAEDGFDADIMERALENAQMLEAKYAVCVIKDKYRIINMEKNLILKNIPIAYGRTE